MRSRPLRVDVLGLVTAQTVKCGASEAGKVEKTPPPQPHNIPATDSRDCGEREGGNWLTPPQRSNLTRFFEQRHTSPKLEFPTNQ